jgi:chemotaxis protein CheZ
MNLPAIASRTERDPPPANNLDMEGSAYEVFQRIGLITRRLHDALRDLGYDKTLASAVDGLPDARARLAYIAKLTGESANKVLNAAEFARAAQDEMRQGADALKARWSGETAASLGNPMGETLVKDTNAFLLSLSASTELTNHHLTEIMLAQDFHDLTGQVIRKVVDLAQTLEEQLLALLMETTPPEQRAKLQADETGRLSGPVVHAEGRADIVTNQSQVDEMLESLGF